MVTVVMDFAVTIDNTEDDEIFPVFVVTPKKRHSRLYSLLMPFFRLILTGQKLAVVEP